MVKFPQIGLLLQLLADAFLVTQSADSKTEGRDGSKFRDELNELAKGKTLKNFKNLSSYLVTQLGELDQTWFLLNMTENFINFYRKVLKENHGRQATNKEVYDWLLNDACNIIATSINVGWHSTYAPSNKIAKSAHAVWFLPDLATGKSALGVLFDFLKQECNLTPYAIAKNYSENICSEYKNKNKNDNTDPANMTSSLNSDWTKRFKLGEFAKTDLQTFEKLEKAIWFSIKDKKLMDKERLRLNLLLARGFDYLIAKLKPVFGEKQLQVAIEHIKTNVARNERDIPFLWDERGIYLLYPEIGYPLDEVDRLTKVRTAKKQHDEDKVLRGLQFLEQQQPFAKIYKAILLWYTGRYWLLSGMPEKAIDFYKKAFSEMQFVWGRDVAEKFIEESLALTAFMGKDRRFFEDVYHYGALIGLFAPLEEREVDYQYHQWGLAFNRYFSPDAYYHSVSAEKKQEIIEQGSWIKAVTFDEINKAADKKSKTNVFNTRPKSQLQLAIHARDKTAEDVIKLIDNGVDVNYMDNSGGTALIEALQKYYGLLGIDKNEKALKVINRLLAEDLSKSINSVSKGKGISALSLAIDTFDMDMINRLITSGANVKGNCHKPEMSYIYYSLNRYAWSKQTSSQYALEDKTVAIIKLLLENGASLNGHFINDLTPLMLATELGLTKVVKLLLEYKADINALNNCGKKAVDYAIGFCRPEIKNLLAR